MSLNHLCSWKQTLTWKTFFFFQGRGVRVVEPVGEAEHSKPTSWYKFAKRNTGLIVCGVDAGCIQIESLLKCPLPCMAQWLMYNKSTKGGFNTSNGQVQGTVILSFLQYLIGSFPWNITPRFQMTLPKSKRRLIRISLPPCLPPPLLKFFFFFCLSGESKFLPKGD